MFPQHFWDVARSRLDTHIQDQRFDAQPGPFLHSPTKKACLVAVSKRFLSKSSSDMASEMLYVFIMHCILLDDISVHERARPMEVLNQDLNGLVVNSFLPEMFLAVNATISSSQFFLDLDGRVFQSLLRFFTSSPTVPPADIVGDSVYARASEIWSELRLPLPDFRSFATRFPAPPLSVNAFAIAKALPLQILPFDNEVFNLELSAVQIAVDNQGEHDMELSASHFGQEIPFSDTQHWHDHRKAILTGRSYKPVEEWRRRWLLKGDQRFMATLQRQAATLTGALGKNLQRITILPASAKVSSDLCE
jgi:hypothetical protein